MAKSKHFSAIRQTVTLITLLLAGQIYAQEVDTLVVFSKSMNKQIKNVVISPENYSSATTEKYPVVYVLHGYSGRFDQWIKSIKPNLPQIATSLQMIIICPDGANSWYWDSPMDSTSRYETYITKELVEVIDNKYNTIEDRSGRAITGLSMGGHGALWLALQNPNIYGACGSMSGGVDIRPFPNNWEMKKLLGTYSENKQRWDEYTVINQLDGNTPRQLAIIVDCGTEDFFYDVNVALHNKLLANKIPHDFISRPGAHTEKYWRNAIDFQLIFFKNFFTTAATTVTTTAN